MERLFCMVTDFGLIFSVGGKLQAFPPNLGTYIAYTFLPTGSLGHCLAACKALPNTPSPDQYGSYNGCGKFRLRNTRFERLVLDFKTGSSPDSVKSIADKCTGVKLLGNTKKPLPRKGPFLRHRIRLAYARNPGRCFNN
jgi:hypothetical protein